MNNYAYFVIVVEGELLRHGLANELTCLECPCSRDIAHCVPTTPENDNWHSKALNIAHAIGVTIHTEIEASQPVARKTVAAALENDGFWAVISHDGLDCRLEDVFVRLVCNAIAEREIDRVILAGSNADVSKLASARKVLPILVKGHRHDAIGGVEGFLDTVTMVHVDVDIKHALLVPQKLDNTKDNV